MNMDTMQESFEESKTFTPEAPHHNHLSNHISTLAADDEVLITFIKAFITLSVKNKKQYENYQYNET